MVCVQNKIKAELLMSPVFSQENRGHIVPDNKQCIIMDRNVR
uniref:Uncharacterized protein n=1 Tax=Anguilla anguilla TaxID=7936 RepID=A0A0E9XPY6_ANGAN